MAAQLKHFTFVKQTGIGNQTVTGVGFRPKALLVWSSRLTAPGAADAASMTIGMTDGTVQMCRFVRTNDNAADTQSAQAERSDSLIFQTATAASGGTPTIQNKAAFVDFTDDGFTIEWTVNDDVADVFQCLAFGGTMQAKQKEVKITVANNTDQPVTGVGFEADCFIVIGGAMDEFGSGQYNVGAPFGSFHGFGFGDGASINLTAWTMARATGTVSDANAGQHTNKLASVRVSNNSSLGDLCAFQINETTSDGFIIHRTSAYQASGIFGLTPIAKPVQNILCLQGIQFKVGTLNAPTTAQTQNLTLGFEPSVLLLQTINSTSETPAKMDLAIGAWDADGAASAWVGGTDNVNPTVYARSYDAHLLTARTPNATGASSAVALSVDVASTSASGAVLDFTTVPGSAVPILYFAAAPTDETVPPVTIFRNDREIQLVWVEITDRAGTVHAISEAGLPDRQVYFHGWKAGNLTAVGTVQRHLSDRYGEHVVPTFTFSIFDEGSEWRSLAADPATSDFTGMKVVYRGITDADRRAELTPRVLFRGIVREHKWVNDFELEFVCEDELSQFLAVTNDQAQLPKHLVSTDDFSTADDKKVPSSAQNYTVNGGAATGATEVPVTGGTGQFAAGDNIVFGTDAVSYQVASSSKSGVGYGVLIGTETAETTITLSTPLLSDKAGGTAIAVSPSHDVSAAVGTGVPFVYGTITDTRTPGSSVTLPTVNGALPAPVIVGQLGRSGGDLRTPLNPSGRRWTYVAGYDAGTNRLSPLSNQGSNIARDDDYSNPSGVAVQFTGDPMYENYYLFVGDSPDFDPYATTNKQGSGHYCVQVIDDNTADGLMDGADFETVLLHWTDGTDLIADAPDTGIGEGPMKYVGDELVGGILTGLFLWAGHRCYSPDGKPFISLNFWDTPVDLPTLAGTGERLIVPGYDRWTDVGFGANSYLTRNTHDYTIVGLQGVFRDWALGIAPVPPGATGVAFAVNAYGRMAEDGSLLRSGPQVYKDAWKQYIKGDYRGGALLTAPFFDDDPTLSTLDEASFDAVEAQQIVRIGSAYPLDFIVGANNESISFGVFVKRLNIANDCDSGYNTDLQFEIKMVEDDETTAETGASTLDDVQDILDEGGNELGIDDQDTNLGNAIKFSHTPDYLGRQPAWRSALSGFNEAFHAASVDRHHKVYAPPLEIHFIRGKNGVNDPDDYQDGTDAVHDILGHRLRRTAEAPRIYTVPTGMRGFNAGEFDLGRTAFVVSIRNVGGRTPRLVRIQGVQGRAGAESGGHVVTFEAEDQTRLVTEALSVSYAAGLTEGSTSTAGPIAATGAGTPGGAAGSGDVLGPASSLDNEITRFSGVTGKVIQAGSGVLLQDDGRITTLTDPTGAQDAATKAYVDATVARGVRRSTVRAATTANITISTALNNGDSLDGVTLATGNLVLVKNQSAPEENGIYTVGVTPARAPEFDTYDEHPGTLVTVQEGTTNADTLWLCTSNAGGTLNATAIAFAAFTTGSGTGDVVGPGSATDNGVVRFDGTTGKLIQNTSGPTMPDDGRISNVTDPTSAQDAATKTYVDSAVATGARRSAVRAATTANITISTALNNGDSLDGVTLATGNLVLVKDQSAPAENGIYVVGVSPARDTQFDTYDEHPGSLIAVEEGTANADTLWLCTSNVGGTLNSTALAFSQITTGSTLPVVDSTAIAKGSSDATKLVRFEVDTNVSAGATRVITVANQDVDLTPNTGTYPAAVHHTRHESGGADAIKLDDLAAPDNNTDLNVSTSAHGLAPVLPNDATKYLDGTGGYTTPAGTGSTLPVVDTTAVVKGSGDPTKLVRIEADGIATATTRVITMPDQDVDLTPDVTFAGAQRNLGTRVRAATTANITISTALNNGDTLDGVSLVTGDLVLVKDQSTAADNGIYVVGASPARAVGYDTYNEHPGSILYVQEGTVNADTIWVCTSNVGGTLTSTAIAFTHFVSAGTSGNIRTLVCIVDGGSSVITTGFKDLTSCPWTGTITAWRVLSCDSAFTAGEISFKIWKEVESGYPPATGDNITGTGTKPNIAATNTKGDGTDFTNWTTTTFTAGDIVAFEVTSCTSIKKARVELTITLT